MAKVLVMPALLVSGPDPHELPINSDKLPELPV
jgi:hypothetical protein